MNKHPRGTSPSDRAGTESRSPLGALPTLSRVARRALITVGALSLVGASLLVAQAFLLASALAAIVAGNTSGLGDELRWLVVIVAGRGLVVWATRAVSQRAAVGVKQELREAAIDRSIELGPEWIAARGTGQLAMLLTRELDALDGYFTEYLPALVTAAVVPLVIGVAVLYADWPSAVILALTLPLLPMFAILVGKHTQDTVRHSTESAQRLAGHLLELVRSLPVLWAFGRARAQSDAVRAASERHRRATLATLRVAFLSAFVLELAATLSVALIAVVIGVRLVSGDMALAIGLGVLILVPDAYQPIRAVGAAFHSSQDGVAAVSRIAEVLSGRAGPRGSAVPNTRTVRVEELRVVRRSGFAPDGESFIAYPGSITWLHTPSGAGKSTTLAVLLGFTRPSSGSVTIGDVPLTDIDVDVWRSQVAWVPQHPVLTERTVRAELAEQGNRRPSDHEIDAVAAELGIHDVMDRDPAQLSIGQRQRVAVARALLRAATGAWLLLLDEPTAHLDEENAARVMSAVHDVAARGATVILAAHTRAPNEPAPTSPRHELVSDAPEPDREGTTGTPLPLRELISGRLLGGAAIGALSLLAGVALTATSGWLIARASQQPPILILSVAVVGVRTFGLARASLRYLERLVSHDAALRIATTLRVRLWQALLRRGPASALAAADEQERLVHDVDTVRDLLPRVLTPPLVVLAVVAGAVLTEALLLPAAGGVLAATVAAGGVVALLAARGAERRATTWLAASRRRMRKHVLAMFEGAAELAAFGRLDDYRAAAARADAAQTRHSRRAAWGEGVATGVITLTTGAAAVAGTALAASAVATGALDPVLAPVLALVPLALAEILAQLQPVVSNAATLRASRHRLAILTAPATTAPHPDVGEMRLRGATVRWPGAVRPALVDVDLDLRDGETLAVVGPSGAGKSTLLATLLGFLRPERGTVQLPADIIWAPQHPRLAATSLAENLRLGAPSATDAELADVLRTVRLPEFAERLDLVLGSAGAGLSGGQARRVALARALLAARRCTRPALVLLDEPTAHLDVETARALLRTLRAELARHIVVHVTHHSDEATDADTVLKVCDGRARQHDVAITVRQPRHANGVVAGTGSHYHAVIPR